MNKKDRAAVVISVILFFLAVMMAFDDKNIGPVGVCTFILLVYWGVRFVKGNISFIKIKEQE